MTHFLGIATVFFILLWKSAAIMPDGRIAGLLMQSVATEAGLKINDIVVIIDGKKYSEDSLPASLPNARYVIIRRDNELIPVMNPRIKR